MYLECFISVANRAKHAMHACMYEKNPGCSVDLVDNHTVLRTYPRKEKLFVVGVFEYTKKLFEKKVS